MQSALILVLYIKSWVYSIYILLIQLLSKQLYGFAGAIMV